MPYRTWMPTRSLAAALLLVLLCPGPSTLAADDAGETTERWIENGRARIELLMKEDRLREAVEEWSALARLQPGEIAPLEKAALLAVRCGGLEGERFRPGARFFVLAEGFVRRASKDQQAESPDLLYVIARLNFAANSWEEAFLLFGEARRIGCTIPDLDRYLYRAATYSSGALLESGRHDAPDVVVKRLTEVRERTHDDPELPDVERLHLYVTLADAHNLRQEEPVALDLLTSGIEEYGDKVPGNSLGWAYRLLGDIHRNRGAFDVAIGHYRTLLDRVNPTEVVYAEGLLRLADALFRAEPPQLEEAEARCRDYLALRPSHVTGLLTLGRILDAANRPAEALAQYRAARETSPDAIDVLDRLRSALYLLDTPEARAELADVEHAIKYIRNADKRPIPRREDESDDE